MANLEIPEGELRALAHDLDAAAQLMDEVAGVAQSLRDAAAGLPGSQSGPRMGEAGLAVDLELTHIASRTREVSREAMRLELVFTSLDGYYEGQFAAPPGGHGWRPI